MAEYVVNAPCELLGIWRKSGDVLVLTDAQAAALAPPYGTVIRPAPPRGKGNGRLNRNKRAKRTAAE